MGEKLERTPAGIDRRTFLLGSAAVTTLPALLAACGGSAGVVPARPVASKNPLKVACYFAIIDLNPHGPNDVDTGTMTASRQIYDSLVVRSGKDYLPSLAKSWKQTSPTTWVFTLRDDVTFHDGSRLTASDVKASLEALTATSTPQTALWATLSSVEATNDTTVTITTTQPLGTMLVNLSLLFITPAAKMTQPNFFQKPVGSGPFKVQSFVPSDHLTLEPNKQYWGKKTQLSGLTIQFISEASANTAAIKSGQIQVNWPVSSDQVEPLQGASGLKLVNVPSWSYYWNWFNSSRAPFTDANVRRAMWYALDVKTIVKSLFGNSAEVMKAPIPSSVFGYAPQKPYHYDPDLAKHLLQKAGLGSGFTTSINWYSTSGPQIDELAQTLISYWAKIGVKVTPNNLEEAEWLSRLLALDWDMDLQTELDTTGDADYNLGRLYLSTAHRNGYSNPTLDNVLLQARATANAKTRQKLYAQACNIIWDDAVGIFPCTLVSTYAISQNVKDFVATPSEQPYFSGVKLSSGS